MFNWMIIACSLVQTKTKLSIESCLCCFPIQKGIIAIIAMGINV